MKMTADDEVFTPFSPQPVPLCTVNLDQSFI